MCLSSVGSSGAPYISSRLDLVSHSPQNDIGNTWCECGQKTGRKANLKGAVVVTFTSGTFFTGSELRLCADARTSVRTRTDHYHQYISFSLDCDTKVHPPHPRHVNIIFWVLSAQIVNKLTQTQSLWPLATLLPSFFSSLPASLPLLATLKEMCILYLLSHWCNSYRVILQKLKIWERTQKFSDLLLQESGGFFTVNHSEALG